MQIELRSDTFTKPTPAMMQAMMQAKTGDDVYGEDPEVNQLQQYAADMFGMGASLFCPSGTMTNQIALNVHTQPGDEVICDENAHVYKFEGGGLARNSGASVRLISGDKGCFTLEDVKNNINPDDPHYPITSLVALENTVNRGGGSYWDFSGIQKIRQFCDQKKLKLHLDGARLFNALTETPQSARDYGNSFDSISICLSKGLGAPVGSLLLGSHDFIKQARRVRKVFGGGMRQAGFMAAAGTHALKHHIQRLKEDHQRARILASELAHLDVVEDIFPVPTNIIIFKLKDEVPNKSWVQKLSEKNIRVMRLPENKVRVVTHLDFNDDMMNYFIETIKKV